ncbi:MAG: diacylglycerol kinase family lipid kinase [Calditrichia bacterium]
MQKIRFIVNPISGINRNPQKIVRWIESTFEPAPVDFEICYTKGAGDATHLARQAVEQKFDMVAAVGGDGTINEAGQALIYTDTVLGVVPAGSGNGFARNFGIPLDQRKAIKLLLNSRVISVDVGKINDNYFFNVAGTGLDAEISRDFEQFGIRGPIPYFLVGTRNYLRYHPHPVKLIYDNSEIEYGSPLILSIANAPQYGNGAIIAPSARPDDGLLDVCVMEQIPIWKAAPNIYRLFNGTIDQVEGFHTLQLKDFTIERSGEGAITLTAILYRNRLS